MKLNKTEQNIGAIISILALLLFSTYLLFGILGQENVSLIFTTLGAILLCLIAFSFYSIYKLRKSRKHNEIDYLNIGVQRYLLGIFMIFYGIPKLFGAFFDYQLSALDTKLVSVTDFELAWYYFGKKNWLELVSGILEFVPALFLFHRRTYYVASLVLLFVTSQVFILNFFFKIGGITLPAATILLACNIYIIYSQKQRIIEFFKSLNFTPSVSFNKLQNTLIKIFKTLAFLICALIIYIKVKPNLTNSSYQKKYQTLVGKFTLEKVTKNNKIYIPNSDSTLYKDLYIEKQERWNLLRDYNNITYPFVLNINSSNDSLALYLNKGGTGDDVDILDSTTVIKGIYTFKNNQFIIKGIQQKDTLELIYNKQNLEPKKWLW